MSRSSVAARTKRPQRVRASASDNAASTTGASTISNRSYWGTGWPKIVIAPASPGARGPSRSSGAPDGQRGILDQQHDAEGRDQLQQFWRAVEAPQQRSLDQHAQRADRQRREQHPPQ